MFLIFAAMLIPLLYKRFSYRSVCLCASVVSLLSNVLSSLAPNVYCLYASFGVMLGKTIFDKKYICKEPDLSPWFWFVHDRRVLNCHKKFEKLPLRVIYCFWNKLPCNKILQESRSHPSELNYSQMGQQFKVQSSRFPDLQCNVYGKWSYQDRETALLKIKEKIGMPGCLVKTKVTKEGKQWWINPGFEINGSSEVLSPKQASDITKNGPLADGHLKH